MPFDQRAFNQFIVENDVYGFFEDAITLKSGRQSHFYVNWRTVVEDAYLTEQLVEHVMAFVTTLNVKVDTFYGVPEGATKLGVLTQFVWARRQPGYTAGSHALAMGRAKPKEHGHPKDRFFVGLPRGRVLVIEDTTTTGGSAIKSLEHLKETGIDVVGMVGLTNRMEKRDDGSSVKDAVEALGIPFFQMSGAPEVLPMVYEKLIPGEKVARAIEAEFGEYGLEPVHLLG